MAENGLFFDENELLSLGISLPTVEAIKRLLEKDVDDNTSDVAQNTADIATNTTDIAANTVDITSNSSNISTNTSDIGNNATDIGSLQSGKADKVIPTVVNNIALLDGTGNLVDSGLVIADLLTQNNAGNPNGVVTSNQSRLCVDTTGGQIYFNPVVGVNVGWIAV